MGFLAALPAILGGAGAIVSSIGKRKDQKNQYKADSARHDQSEKARIALLTGLLKGLGVDVADPRIVQSFLTPRTFTGAKPSSILGTIGGGLTGLSKFLPVNKPSTSVPGSGAGSGLNISDPAFEDLYG